MRRGLLVTFAALAAILLPGCTSSGHSTPAAATAGYVNAVDAKDYQRACSYVVPSQVAVCKQVLLPEPTQPFPFEVEGLRLGDTTVSGARALVTILGRFCTPSNRGTVVCFNNDDPASGQPVEESFDDAYKTIANETDYSPDDLAETCRKVHGQWYVDLGIVAGDT